MLPPADRTYGTALMRTNLGREQGGAGCHRYLRYRVSGRWNRRQSNSARTKGQLAESYSGYVSSATQLPANMSHDDDPDADGRCWCFRDMVIAAAAAAAVHAARSAATTAAEIAARRVILPRRRRGLSARAGKVLVTAEEWEV